MNGISPNQRDPLSMFDVSGRVAIITGASGAFGRACALMLGALGSKLVLASGSDGELARVLRDVEACGGTACSIARRPDSLGNAEAIRDFALDRFGRIDRLVIASGHNRAGSIQDLDYEDWQAVMDANVRGPWYMAKAVGTYWIEREIKGKMLMMSSVRGRHGAVSGYTGYCTSKGAIDALTRTLATEWGKHGITVNSIAPTVFRSRLTAWIWNDDPIGEATRNRSLSRIPLGRLGEVDDLMGMALYLLSPASDFCRGQIMYVDGGFTAG